MSKNIYTITPADNRGRSNIKVNNKTIARAHIHAKSVVVYTSAKYLGTDLATLEKKFAAKNTAKRIRADKVQVNAAYTSAIANGKTERFYGKLNFKVTEDLKVEDILQTVANLAIVPELEGAPEEEPATEEVSA